jgi:hypothetical protein
MTTATTAGLFTLCYRVDPDQLGNLTVYPLTEEFLAAWSRLKDAVRARAGREDTVPSYSALATALTAASNQPVRLFPRFDLSARDTDQGVIALLVTTKAFDPWILATTTRTFERRSTGDHTCDTLVPLITAITPVTRPMTEFIDTDADTGAITAPGWIYDCARWNLAAAIADTPLKIDGTLPIRFRLDTDANLLAWAHPLSRASKNTTGHAIVQISTAIITLPGAANLYLRLDGHVSRQPYTWAFVRNTWLDRGDPTLPIIKVPVLSPYPEKGRLAPQFKGFTAEVIESCGLTPITLPAALPAIPGPVRPIGKPRKHSIGKGPGVRFLHQLGKHAADVLGVAQLGYAPTPITVQPQVTGPIPPARLDTAITASGATALRITCLYASEPVRRRMIDALAGYALAGPHQLAGIADDQPVPLTDRCTVVIHKDTRLLEHGTHKRLLDGITCLQTPPATAVAALVETDWDPDNPPDNDAKNPLREALASHGIVTQFLNGNWTPPEPRKRTRKGVTTVVYPRDEPAIAAVRDLLRHAGVIDNRLATATAGARLAGALEQETILVGLHVRQHTPRRRGNTKPPTRLVIRLVAIHATPDPEQPWRTDTYSDRHGTWVPYREGTAAYHATDIGAATLSRERKHYPAIRDYVDEALTGLGRSIPMVIFVDAEGCRGIWPGLNNDSFGRGPLPGSSLRHPDLAVVRVATGARVPRPTHRSHGQQPKDKHQPALPGSTLYEHDERGVPSWLLAQKSRTYRSQEIGARAGASYTRWTVPDDKAQYLGKDWHGLTGIEIAVASTGTWQPRHLAALAARLCHQAASWDDRTQHPTPLHLAELPDLDHPRRSEQPDDNDTE